jgi:hypothetical protein
MQDTSLWTTGTYVHSLLALAPVRRANITQVWAFCTKEDVVVSRRVIWPGGPPTIVASRRPVSTLIAAPVITTVACWVTIVVVAPGGPPCLRFLLQQLAVATIIRLTGFSTAACSVHTAETAVSVICSC